MSKNYIILVYNIMSNTNNNKLRPLFNRIKTTVNSKKNNGDTFQESQKYYTSDIDSFIKIIKKNKSNLNKYEKLQKNGVLKDNELAKNIIQWFMLNELIKNKKNNNNKNNNNNKKEKRISLIAEKIIPICIYIGIDLDDLIAKALLKFMSVEEIDIEKFKEIYLHLAQKIDKLKLKNN